jgi:hypothetical protein
MKFQLEQPQVSLAVQFEAQTLQSVQQGALRLAERLSQPAGEIAAD